MLAVPCKSAKGLDWSGPLRTYLSNNYSGKTLDEHASSIQRLSTARESIANVNDASPGSVDQTESYLRMLGQVEPRFPLGEGGLKLSFTWFDALKPGKKLSMANVTFEKACVLFNLGALLSRQGMVQDRGDVSGLKKACQFFMQSAGVFLHLRDNVMGKELVGPCTSDMSQEGLSMLYYLMLGQAQACFYEKAIRDGLKPALLAKLSAQACTFYEKAWEASKSSTLSSTLDAAWPSHLHFQFLCFGATAQFQYSKVVHGVAEQTTEGYGEEIARLALASDLCQTGLNHGTQNKLPAVMLETVGHLRSVINKTMDQASTANNTIYMQVIPPKSGLSRPAGSALAKPTMPKADLTDPANVGKGGAGGGSGEDAIFQGLLPVAMQETEALFQSRLSSLVEETGKKVESAAEDIKLRLSEANLPAAVEAGDGSHGIPDRVWERLNTSVLSRGGVDALRRGIASNERLSNGMESQLAEVERQLNSEEAEDGAMRQKWADKWNTSTSAELSMHMRNDVKRYRQLLREANESDRILQDKLTGNMARMELLGYSKAKLDGLFPDGAEVDQNPQVEAMREKLALQLITLGAAIQDLEMLQGQLVDDTSNDSITVAMTKAPGGPQAIAASDEKRSALIEREAGKYRSVTNEIEQKIRNLPPLLSRVLDDNHAFSAERNQTEAMKKREGVIAEIYLGIDLFEETAMFIAEGEKFYMNLSGRVEMLKTTGADHCYVRELQRKELDTQLTQALGGGGGGGGGGGSAGIASAVPAGSGAYPGMLARQASVPLMQPYAAGGIAQAFPVDAPAPAYPVSNQAPPPSYNASTSAPSSNDPKLTTMKSTLGNAFTDAQLNEALSGADGDVNIAINHLLGAEPSPTAATKRKSKKRLGFF